MNEDTNTNAFLRRIPYKIEVTNQLARVLAAIAAAGADIGSVAKSEFNKFDNYPFASIDNFLAATGPACHKNGLLVLQKEISCETITRNGKPWLEFVFAFEVIHTSGESLEPITRTVSVPWNGAQAYGSGQSYALKQFLRSLFQIPTGDRDDPDHGQPPDVQTEKQKPTRSTKQAIRKPEPTTETDPVEMISTACIQLIEQAVDDSEWFTTRDQFYEWIWATKRKPIIEFTSDEGGRLLAFLKRADEPAKWPTNLHEAWISVVRDSMRYETDKDSSTEGMVYDNDVDEEKLRSQT